MYRLHRLGIVLCAGVLLLAVTAAPAMALNQVHIVQRGETLAIIARRYDVPLSVLVSRNGIENRDLIFVGQRVVIPAVKSIPVHAPGIHAVRVGDSLPDIATLYGVPLEMVLFLNRIDSSSAIWVGQLIQVPIPSIRRPQTPVIAPEPLAVPEPLTVPEPITVDPDATSHRVRRGDTLHVIARAYGVDMRELIAHNRLQNPDLLFAGQVLEFPTHADGAVLPVEPPVPQPPAVQEPPVPAPDPVPNQAGPQDPDSVVHVVEQGETLSDSPVDTAFSWADAQIVSFYGFPGIPFMGVLGDGPPRDVAPRIAAMAERYDQLNGPRGTQPAFHLIVGVAQAGATPDGAWISRLSHDRIAEYVEAAREEGLLLFLDTQIGWSDPLAEVKLLTPFLREPFVHVALDPEFATERLGVRPGQALGSISADDVNAVQRYLASIVHEEGLPPKLLMVHQFAERMFRNRGGIEDYEAVHLSFDMDGFGGTGAKLNGYRRFALPTPSERPALKLFFKYDTPLMTPEQVQGLGHPPDIIIYQ